MLTEMHRYALHMLTDHDKLDIILEGDERLDLVKLFEKVFYVGKGAERKNAPNLVIFWKTGVSTRCKV